MLLVVILVVGKCNYYYLLHGVHWANLSYS